MYFRGVCPEINFQSYQVLILTPQVLLSHVRFHLSILSSFDSNQVRVQEGPWYIVRLSILSSFDSNHMKPRCQSNRKRLSILSSFDSNFGILYRKTKDDFFQSYQVLILTMYPTLVAYSLDFFQSYQVLILTRILINACTDLLDFQSYQVLILTTMSPSLEETFTTFNPIKFWF